MRQAIPIILGRRSASAVWLVATTCPTCGKVKVRDSDGHSTIVSLRSSTRRARAVLRVPWPAPTSGRVSLQRVAGAGRVTIDGLVMRAP